MSETKDRRNPVGDQGGMGRREFLRKGAMTAAAPLVLGTAATWAGATGPDLSGAGDALPSDPIPPLGTRLPFADLEEATMADLSKAMESGELTAEELTRRYLARIEESDRPPAGLRAVLEVNPDALSLASERDRERKAGRVRGALHGIPILLKDNIDTADRMETTAGSLALLGTRPAVDATVAARLREAGAVLLGKTNLSEWANMRSSRSSSGWSARGGQCRNPYVVRRSPCGSSSGSAAAVAANLCAAALGTETDGSIVCPSHINGVVGIKPTVGLTSRAGVVPISHSQDTVGPHARTVRDAALVLSALVGAADPRDPATSKAPAPFDYASALDAGALKGARIGVLRKAFTGYSPHTDSAFEAALEVLKKEGAILVDPADLPTTDDIVSGSTELTVLLYDLKADMAAYLAGRVPAGTGPRTLADLIAWNDAHAEDEMRFFGQELFLEAEKKGPLTDSDYIEALATNRRLAGKEGIDAVMDKERLDALVAPTGGPAWPIDWVNGDHFLGASSSPAAMAGTPIVNVPMGFVFGLPLGISFMGKAWSEAKLLRLAHGFEQATRHRRPPRFLTDIEV